MEPRRHLGHHPVINLADVEAAERRIGRLVRRTPVGSFQIGSFQVGAPVEGFEVWLKLEQLQHTGSFKVRGALNRIIAAAEEHQIGPAGVVAASGGNAGLAVAYAARLVDVPVRVYVPLTAPDTKVRGLRDLGAEVHQIGDRYADAYEAAVADSARTGALYCHAYDQPEICAGQGTVAVELLQQTGGQVDTVLVAVGGGGLMAGVASALEGHCRVVGVEPESAPTLHAALRAGQPVDVPVSGVAADALGATRLGQIAWAVATRTGVQSVLVTDADIVDARRRLWADYRLVVEPAGACALAALWSGAYTPTPGERVAIIICGANTAIDTLEAS